MHSTALNLRPDLAPTLDVQISSWNFRHLVWRTTVDSVHFQLELKKLQLELWLLLHSVHSHSSQRHSNADN